ncbi:BamA/TamA family outer membrane protein [Bergeyella cardium]|uniref:BamA/TamA family outer membrane protein n=1 Tax=Bergeyella cardium TaxID=1585976 RepID=A0A6P1QYA8_9FLAO|nr:BamA/TamA family outer membrane protein [Bergeyella cardium]QHN65690.1 BamA/TamA family outer membrane protein [Bergeyella cardium]WHE33279.1 BamA/TamA family outer membrane protein [Bergeyella cardium]WHF59928.1 BamA/TamA family outer membrane protein [Bergeyella cardium]
MGCKHIKKYFQKYYIFFCSASTVLALLACSTTKKVPKGEFLLTKNKISFKDGKVLSSEIPDYIIQKPNKSAIPFLPSRLLFYNMTNPKYDTILNDYMAFPSDMRNRNLLDSLFIKYNHPEYRGKSLWGQRFLHNLGSQPVIWNAGKTKASANNIRKMLIYHGYWDAETTYKEDLDSSAKKAKIDYIITHKDPTMISEYHYRISDPGIRSIYEGSLHKTIVRAGHRLDQSKLESEAKRISELMQNEGYYKFNASNEEIFFTADTLSSRKKVPLFLEIRKDSLDSPYHKTKIGDIKVVLKDNDDNTPLKKDSIRGISFEKANDHYKSSALWRAVILQPGEVYKQRNFDLTKRNFTLMNNFNISQEIKERAGADSILDVRYTLKPLPRYEFKVSTDATYSQILNFGLSPALDFTSRNIFRGAENFNANFSGVFGFVEDTKNTDKRTLASEISAQVGVSFPRLLLPFKYYKLIPKRYSPTSSITLGTSIQNNLGLGRLNFNAGLNYYADVNEIVSHKLSLFNTQLSFTRDKDSFYNFFPRDRELRNSIFKLYDAALYQQFEQGLISSNDFTERVLSDPNFAQTLSKENQETYTSFLQSLYNKERQTQDVIISSILYNFTYNEIGKQDYKHPFYFNARVETAGNLLGLFSRRNKSSDAFESESRNIFGVPYSQFVKLDFDIRKYFKLYRNQTLAIRQLIGIGIPYGNSRSMPFVRSYFTGGSNDIRAWRVYGGLGPADSQIDPKIRAYVMENLKLTTNIEYRISFNKMFEGALFADAGNIWSLNNNDFGGLFKFNKFISQMGIGTGFGLRINIAYITLRIDTAYKVYDPNLPVGNRWVFKDWRLLDGIVNFAFGYPF